MKKISFLLLAFIVLAIGSCDKFSNNYSLKGTIKGIPDGAKVYLFENNYKTKKIDTL